MLVLAAGFKTGNGLPVEVLPDLTKPTVTILTEAPGLSPEEVEALVTQPIENSMMGVAGLSVAYHAKPKVREQAMVAIEEGGLDRLLEVLQ